MIHIVTAENRHVFDADLVSMHRQRKHIFVDGLGWPLPVESDQEIDAYDGEHTTYLLAQEADATLLASARLLPTTGPHLMADLFAHSCDGGTPRGTHIWEASRFCPAPALPRRKRLSELWRIFCAILETALLYDIHRIIFTANRALLPLALECGWNARRLGPTLTDGSDTMTAVGVEVDLEGLRTLRRRFRIHGPVTRFVTPARLAA